LNGYGASKRVYVLSEAAPGYEKWSWSVTGRSRGALAPLR